MKPLEDVRIAQKPTAVLMTIMMVGLCTNFLPAGWEPVSRLGLACAFFAAGMLVAQHAAIWEKGQRIRRKPDEDER